MQHHVTMELLSCICSFSGNTGAALGVSSYCNIIPMDCTLMCVCTAAVRVEGSTECVPLRLPLCISESCFRKALVFFFNLLQYDVNGVHPDVAFCCNAVSAECSSKIYCNIIFILQYHIKRTRLVVYVSGTLHNVSLYCNIVPAECSVILSCNRISVKRSSLHLFCNICILASMLAVSLHHGISMEST